MTTECPKPFIDVVIPCHPKDAQPEPTAPRGMLEESIEGIKGCPEIANVYTISPKPLTYNASWLPEDAFPFSFESIAAYKLKHRPGWYMQQLIKIYTPIIYHDLSRYVLLLDADTVFCRPTRFMDDNNRIFFNFLDDARYMPSYDGHLGRLIPGMSIPGLLPARPCGEPYSGVSHKALFDREIIIAMMHEVEKHHQMPFWKAFLECVDKNELNGASEWEIYTCYCLSRFPERVSLRQLEWSHTCKFSSEFETLRTQFDYITSHHFARPAEHAA